ncbi:MAG: histidine ammonia-lyase [Firmicutes bacterium ZCTH02-B6]|nr:MAG: histidine ammonia-lyase [Firmicutes bacterium ZCTH02-B6]
MDALIQRGAKVYGVTTGVGELRTVVIPPESRRELQVNILRSHAAGVGPHLPEAEARAVMLLRVNSFLPGHSGVRPETVAALVQLLNSGVYPAIPEQGSLGASGDLAPLAHLALVLIGEGEAYVDGRLVPGREALASVGLAPLSLGPKEGLALINGTQLMTGIGALVCRQALQLLAWADAAASLTLEALRGNASAFDPRIHRLRPHPGQTRAAAHVRRLTAGSLRLRPYDPAGVQDAYSLRCIPQVHGAVWDVAAHVRAILEREANAVTDNPLLFPEDGEVLNGGNFHGSPVAMAMDYLAIGLAELAGISERRVERLVNPHLSGLPAFLVRDSGLNSGYMLAQYTAAALVSENKALAHPASVDSIPSSANQEDHVSMGPIAARKARTILGNCRKVIAVELCCAAQAVDLSGGPESLAPGTRMLYELVRERVPPLNADRVLARDITAIEELLLDQDAAERLERALDGAVV